MVDSASLLLVKAYSEKEMSKIEAGFFKIEQAHQILLGSRWVPGSAGYADGLEPCQVGGWVGGCLRYEAH